MMGGGRKVLVGGGGVEAEQLGAGEEGLGEARKRTMVSQMASAPVTIRMMMSVVKLMMMIPSFFY